MKWINVKDELPDYDHFVLWYSEDGLMHTDALDKDGNPWLFPDETDEQRPWPIAKTTHWCELPEPPTFDQTTLTPITGGTDNK